MGYGEVVVMVVNPRGDGVREWVQFDVLKQFTHSNSSLTEMI